MWTELRSKQRRECTPVTARWARLPSCSSASLHCAKRCNFFPRLPMSLSPFARASSLGAEWFSNSVLCAKSKSKSMLILWKQAPNVSVHADKIKLCEVDEALRRSKPQKNRSYVPETGDACTRAKTVKVTSAWWTQRKTRRDVSVTI